MNTMGIETPILRRLLTTAVFVSVGLLSFGQELIRGSDDFFNCDSSIVRQVTKDVAYVYNRTKWTSSFMEVTESVTVCPSIYMEPLYMNDFEIKEKQVFFCGYIKENNTKKGILGFFPLSSFPNVDVRYRVVEECTELKKLDVYKIYNMMYGPNPEWHLVATGTTTGVRTDVLIDMMKFTTLTYNCLIHYSFDPDEYFDDVSTTKDYVVVSTRDMESEETPVVNFWEYDTPTVPGMTIFNTSVSRKRISNSVADSPVLLEHMTNNEYLAAYKNSGYSRIAVLKTATGTPVPINVVNILWLEGNVVPRDIKWQSWVSNVDVLTFGHPTDEYRTQIYHLPSAVIGGTTTNGTGTRYSGIKIWSIDPCIYPNRDFVASGSKFQNPKLCRYYYNYTGDCPDEFEYYCDFGKIENKFIEEPLPYTDLGNLPTKILEPRQVDIPFPLECGKME